MAPENLPENLNENTLQHVSGQVWVKGGKVFVKNPSGTGSAPTITPCQGLDLLVNGKKTEERCAVREEDDIILKPCSTEETGNYQIKVNQDGLKAFLEIKAGTATSYSCQDSEPENDLVLEAEKQVNGTCPFSLMGILQELNKRNISYGVDRKAIQGFLLKPEDGTYQIAEGVPPGETTDGRVELNFATGMKEQKITDENEKVNFRDLVEIPSVDPGALLAVYHPGVQGTPGMKVSGDTIPAPKPLVFEFEEGKGVDISPDGNKVYAKISGRPVAKKLGQRYFIDVDPVLHKKGDVDILSGNIRFKGDVVVHGNVCEGMTVQAAGKINIMGMVFDAKLAAQGDITVGQNITGGNLVAGGNSTFFKSFYKILEALHTDLSEIAGLVPGLAQHPKLKEVKVGQLIQLLIDKKYSRVPGLITEMIKLAGQNSFILPREISNLLEKVEKNLSGLNLLKLDLIEQFSRLLSEMKEIKLLMDNMANDMANITFNYSVNSKVEASGDVRVMGSGCINTSIRAGRNVTVKGVFRGGEIIAKGDVILNEAGSEMGARTLIKTGDEKKVYIKKAHEGVRIQIGNRQANITSVQNNMKAKLDEAGTLIILSG